MKTPLPIKTVGLAAAAVGGGLLLFMAMAPSTSQDSQTTQDTTTSTNQSGAAGDDSTVDTSSTSVTYVESVTNQETTYSLIDLGDWFSVGDVSLEGLDPTSWW